MHLFNGSASTAMTTPAFLYDSHLVMPEVDELERQYVRTYSEQ